MPVSISNHAQVFKFPKEKFMHLHTHPYTYTQMKKRTNLPFDVHFDLKQDTTAVIYNKNEKSRRKSKENRSLKKRI